MKSNTPGTRVLCLLFHADLTYHEIMFSYEQGDEAFVSLSYASVPSALLMKMKRGMDRSV